MGSVITLRLLRFGGHRPLHRLADAMRGFDRPAVPCKSSATHNVAPPFAS